MKSTVKGNHIGGTLTKNILKVSIKFSKFKKWTSFKKKGGGRKENLNIVPEISFEYKDYFLFLTCPDSASKIHPEILKAKYSFISGSCDLFPLAIKSLQFRTSPWSKLLTNK